MTTIEEAKLVHESVRRFAERQVEPHLDALNHYPDAALPLEIVPGLRDLGLFSLLLPPSLGGTGSRDTLRASVEALALSAGAPAALLFAHALAQELVLEASGGCGNGPTNLLAKGDDAALLAYPAYTEPTEAAVSFRVDGDTIRLDGTAELVVNAPIADSLVLPVVSDSGEIGLALVERDLPGVTVGNPLLTLGMRGCPTADVTFENARSPAGALVAAPPQAARLLRDCMRRLRPAAVALSAGVLRSSIRCAADYAQERYQGGCNIIDHQEVRAILSRMLSAEATCAQAVDSLSRDGAPEARAASLFVAAKEAAAHATADGVQLLGGYGYMEDFGQERRMRDAKQAQCLLGRCDALRQDLIGEWIEAGTALA